MRQDSRRSCQHLDNTRPKYPQLHMERGIGIVQVQDATEQLVCSESVVTSLLAATSRPPHSRRAISDIDDARFSRLRVEPRSVATIRSSVQPS